MTAYAWVIDKDHLAEPGADPGSFADNAATVSGPSAAPQGLLTALALGRGHKFRLLDDDQEVYYTGRIIFADDIGPNEADDEAAFGPLWDFGLPNAGATEIQYREGGRWVGM